MIDKVLFSVVIPTFNRAGFIEKTIQSVLDQQYKNFEIIIVDDGGTDHTQELIKKIPDGRIQYHFKHNEERAAARNYGINVAKGHYITFLDSDDQLYNNYFTEALKLIEANNNPEFIHLAYELKSTNGKILTRYNKRKGNINMDLLTGNILSCIGIFLKKDITEEYKFNVDKDLTGSEDYELWMRLASRYKIYYSNIITACIINHDERSVLNFNETKLVKRKTLALHYFSADKHSTHLYDKYKNVIEAHLNLYISLHAFMAKNYMSGLKYYIKAITLDPKVILTKKTLGIVKNVLITNHLR